MTASVEMSSQQMKEVHRLVEMNNNAVAMLERGDFEPAISTFARALNLGRVLMGNGSRLEKRQAAISFDQCMERSRAEAGSSEKCHAAAKGAFMYKTAMKVKHCDLPLAYESPVFMAVVLVFNTALAYQLAGDQLLQENLRNTVFLRKAIRLYRLSYSIYHKKTIGASPYFCMAIVNNLGLLYRESQCGEKADKCFQHLLSTLMFLVDCHENMENFEGYFENTAYLFSEKKSRFAPAA